MSGSQIDAFATTYQAEISRFAKIGGWRYLKEGDRTWLSDYVYEIHGLDKGTQLKVSEGITFYKGESRKRIEASFRKVLEDGTPYDLVLAFQNTRGENLWIRTKGLPIFEGEKIIGAWGVIQDISDFFLLESEHNFIQSFSSEVHFILKDWKIVDFNDAWARLSGYTREETIDRLWTEFLHPDDRNQAEALHRIVLKTKRIENLQVRCIHKEGHTFHLNINGIVAPDEETTFAIARDITKEKQDQKKLQESLVKVNAANQAKNQFLMMVSHELRTPLNPIVAFTDILMHQIEDKEQLEMLGLIKDSADHLVHLLSEILDISSIETGRMTVLEEHVDMPKLLQSTFDMMTPKARDKGLRMHLALDDAAETLRHCIGDRRKIRQILLNLINNAIKFTPAGAISVHLLEPVEEDNSVQITLQVKDTGIGIAEDQQQKIFEAFHQVEMSATRVHGGQGLGLALSQKLAHLMDGNISVDSTPGNGSCFTLQLRLKRRLLADPARE